jgi:hypothetical protein
LATTATMPCAANGAIGLHGAGLTARAPGSAGHGGQLGDERLESQNVGHVGGGHGPRCRRDSRRPTRARRDFVQQLTRVDLLVLEDFGMKKLGASAAEDLLEIFVR